MAKVTLTASLVTSTLQITLDFSVLLYASAFES